MLGPLLLACAAPTDTSGPPLDPPPSTPEEALAAAGLTLACDEPGMAVTAFTGAFGWTANADDALAYVGVLGNADGSAEAMQFGFAGTYGGVEDPAWEVQLRIDDVRGDSVFSPIPTGDAERPFETAMSFGDVATIGTLPAYADVWRDLVLRIDFTVSGARVDPVEGGWIEDDTFAGAGCYYGPVEADPA